MHLTVATDSDLGAIAALINAAYRGEAARGGWTHEADYVDGPRTCVETLRRDLAATSGAVFLVLRDTPDGAPTASVWLAPKHDGVWYLGLLAVRPDAQDRQLGRAVLEAAEAYAVARGAGVMRMQVVSIRDSLIAWYARRGYLLTGDRRPFPYGDPEVGQPRRDDLEFVILEKPLR